MERTGCATGIRRCGATGDERIRHPGWCAQAVVAHRGRGTLVARDPTRRDPRPARPFGERYDHSAAPVGRVRDLGRRSDRSGCAVKDWVAIAALARTPGGYGDD